MTHITSAHSPLARTSHITLPNYKKAKKCSDADEMFHEQQSMSFCLTILLSDLNSISFHLSYTEIY